VRKSFLLRNYLITGGLIREHRIMETIKEEEEEIDQEESRLREWNKENNETGNIQDPYEEL